MGGEGVESNHERNREGKFGDFFFNRRSKIVFLYHKYP